MSDTTQTLKDTVIIYHDDCRDGFAAAFAAWKKFGDTASYIPVKNHAEAPAGLVDKEVYIVDFSFHRPILDELEANNQKVVVIDHHISAKEAVTASPQNVFDISHSGCVLAWQYFHPETPVPEVLLYVEDHDIWNLALPEHREFNVALGQVPQTFEAWNQLIKDLEDENTKINFVAKGTVLAKFEDKLVAKILTYKERVLFEGHEVWAVNASRVYRSILANELAEMNAAKEQIPIGICYYHKDGGVNVSLRSFGDTDVAAIAEKYGGGGHKNAASIRVPSFTELPFTFLNNSVE